MQRLRRRLSRMWVLVCWLLEVFRPHVCPVPPDAGAEGPPFHQALREMLFRRLPLS